MANILNFGSLLDRLNIAREVIAITESLTCVRQLLTSLRERGDHWNTYLAEYRVQTTINKKFADPESTFA